MLASQAYARDCDLLSNFGSSLRDFWGSFDLLLESIEWRGHGSNATSAQKGMFSRAIPRACLKLHAAHNVLTDLHEPNRGRYTASNASSAALGTASLPGLTVVASPFLPLTLTSSLLSMSTRLIPGAALV